MTDRHDNDPVVGHDPTNGLAGDLDGDDAGALDPDQDHRSLAEQIVADLDPDRAPGPDDDDSATEYSEEGKP
jgi:hypothetical protein